MERLLKDAQKITGVKYNISNLSDVYNAIHIIQGELGITGTTALEASTTIQGSISSMKSAWQNLLTGISNENVDTDELVSNFVTSITTVAENLKPVIKATIEGLGKVASELLKEILPEDTFNKIKDFVNFIKNNGPEIISTITGIASALAVIKIGTFVASIINFVKTIKEASTIFAGLKIALAAIGGPVTLIIAGIVGLTAGLIALWNTNEGFRNAVIGAWNKIKETAINVFDTIKIFFIETIPNAFQSLLEKLSQIGSNIGEFFENLWNNMVTFFTEKIPNAFQTLFNKIKEISNDIKNFFENLWNSIVSFFTNTIPQWIQNVIEWFSNLPYQIGYQIGLLLGNIIQFGTNVWNWVTVELPKIIEGIIQWFSELPGKIRDWLVNAYNNVMQWGTDVYNTAYEWISNTIKSIIQWFSELPDKIGEWLQNTINNITEWGQNTYNTAKTWASNTITAVVDWFKQLPGKIWTWLTNTIEKVKTWGSDMAEKGKTASLDLFNNVVDTIKDLPGKMINIGKNIVEGLWNGIKNAKDWVVGKVKDFAKGILDGMKEALGIHSPSKLFEDKVGKYIALGIGEGFSKEMKNVTNDMQNSIPTNFNITANQKISASESKTDALINILSTYLPQILIASNKALVLDTGALIGGTIDKYDTALGNNAILAGRGSR